jgi:DNA-binding NarL/FixJ family response regulator
MGMRILLADHRSEVRYALRALLGQRPGLNVVGEAVDANTLMAHVGIACPDLVLLDWRLHGLAALNLLPALRGICPKVVVIALSGRPEERQAALDAGVDAFVSKADPPERLLATIDDYWADNTDGVEG